jgi:heme A synthase
VTSILIAVAVAILTFGSGLVGLYLQKRLPEHHMSGGSKDMILAVIGLVTLLLALVLGTLVGNTYAFFAMQKSERRRQSNSIRRRVARHARPQATP